MLIGLSIAAVTLILDQLSKYWILNYVLAAYPYVRITSFFNIVNAWNTGVSFSLFSSGGMAGKIILSTAALMIVGTLVRWLSKEKNRLLQVALGLIIGGALGNVADRVRLGAVFDFLDFYAAGWHWPAFNLADSAICIGAAIILIEGLFFNKKDEVKK